MNLQEEIKKRRTFAIISTRMLVRRRLRSSCSILEVKSERLVLLKEKNR